MANSVPSREYELIESIRPFCGVPSERWEKGIGDDCAVRSAGKDSTLITADTMVENVHFRLDLMSLAEVGFKAIAGSVSDIFAMGGTAESVLIQLVFPKSENSADQIRELYKGIGEAVNLYGIAVTGGDIASGPCWMIAVTVLGDSGKRVIYRNGARPGDSIWVTGTPGLSALGLDLLLQFGRSSAEKINAEAVHAHVRPLPRRTLSPWIQQNSQITAMIDISDGIGKEVLTICKESGTGAELYLPESIREHLAGSPAREADRLFIGGGEDYELLFTATPDFIPNFENIPFTKIGTVTAECGAYFTDTANKKAPLSGGWDHI